MAKKPAATRPTSAPRRQHAVGGHRSAAAIRGHEERRNRILFLGAGAAVAVIAALFVAYRLSSGGGGTASGGGANTSSYPFVVGQPGPGTPAPPVRLGSTQGGTFDLSAHRGKTVLLYFQEGLTCEPCWTQLKDLEADMQQVRALGVDEVVSITSDPIDQLRQKGSDEGLSSPVLSDPDLAVSSAYDANAYGMMGNSRDGHTFVVVGPDGRIRWRADYGGAPNYTMDVPMDVLLAQMRQGLAAT